MKHLLAITLIITSVYMFLYIKEAQAANISGRPLPMGGRITSIIPKTLCTGKGLPSPFTVEKRVKSLATSFYLPLNSVGATSGVKVGSYILGMYNPVPNLSDCVDASGNPSPQTGFYMYGTSR